MSHRPFHAAWAALALLTSSACSSGPTLKDANLDGLAAISAQIDGARLMQLVSELVEAHRADEPIDCRPWKLRGLVLSENLCHLSRDRSGALLQQRLQELGLRVSRQDLTSDRYSVSNVIADLPGVTRPDEVVVVSAHHDAFYAGADDNSSGVAALIEIARVLSQHRFERTLRFVGFDLEELGAIGSNRYVQAWSDSERLTASVIFDCIGYYDTRPGSQQSVPGLPAEDRGDFTAVITNEPSLPRAAEMLALNRALDGITRVVTLGSPGDGFAPGAEPLLRSDHAAFWLAGKEALFISDTGPFRNPHYHQTTDTIETLHPELFRKTVQLGAASIAYWAGGPL